ncbi:MAG: hypothetical protein EAZ09_06360 [Oscillatoriales cyanobacterium]|nr:MAG: hypothetical protein EAZ18_14270 [Oscillatoriales cyanobacterium]TAH23757.1 MAG: hypothetical protein EAZ09_06360 [Oscillatoriales cyanobacterium]
MNSEEELRHLKLQLEIANTEIDRLHSLNQELEKNVRDSNLTIRQAKDITPVMRPSFRRVLLLARAALLDISKISKIEGGGWLLSMGFSLRRKFKSLRQIWDLLIVDDWVLSELFDSQQPTVKPLVKLSCFRKRQFEQYQQVLSTAISFGNDDFTEYDLPYS